MGAVAENSAEDTAGSFADNAAEDSAENFADNAAEDQQVSPIDEWVVREGPGLYYKKQAETDSDWYPVGSEVFESEEGLFGAYLSANNLHLHSSTPGQSLLCRVE